jgi:TolB-like protein
MLLGFQILVLPKMGSGGKKRKQRGVDVGVDLHAIYNAYRIEKQQYECLKLPTGLVLMETCSSEAVRSQLEKILASEGFARNDRICSFLQFVVEQELSGGGDQLKESVIGVEVFGRRPDYDVRQDSIVRTEAGKLRARLAKYYAGEGAVGQVVIELPKGGYRPVFRNAEVMKEETAAPSWPNRPWSQLRLPWTGIRVWVVLAVGCLAIGLAALAWWRLRPNPEPITIAVLPLINISADPANDYFADGLTGEIIRNLSIIDGLAVRSQTSSFAFKGKPQNVRDAGKQLDAEYILEGSVLRSEQQLRINAQLVRARDDFSVWSGRYDRVLTDVFAIQDEISRGIVNSLRLNLTAGRRRYETSAEAYDLYLRARALGRPGRSIDLYEQAIAKDASFAPAFAGLAAAYVFRTGEDRIDWTGPDRAEEISRMHVVIDKAVQLDPLLAEAQDALGMVLARDAQWEKAEKSFRRALELDPNSSSTRVHFAENLLLPLGRIEEAVTQTRIAEKADPLSTTVRTMLAYALISAGRFDEASALCKKLCTGFQVSQERINLLQGRINETIPILKAQFDKRLRTDPESVRRADADELGYAYALARRRDEAEKMAALSARPIEQAAIFVALGDKDRAFEALDRAIPLGPVRIGRDLTWPEFAPLRGDPRLRTLRKKVGLPE